MIDYQNKIMDGPPDKYQGEFITLAANHIFEVNETAHKLRKSDAQAFHTIVAKILFMCKQAWPYILTKVEFLTTRVREPDEDDDKKLGRILKYLSSMREEW